MSVIAYESNINYDVLSHIFVEILKIKATILSEVATVVELRLVFGLNILSFGLRD